MWQEKSQTGMNFYYLSFPQTFFFFKLTTSSTFVFCSNSWPHRCWILFACHQVTWFLAPSVYNSHSFQSLVHTEWDCSVKNPFRQDPFSLMRMGREVLENYAPHRPHEGTTARRASFKISLFIDISEPFNQQWIILDITYHVYLEVHIGPIRQCSGK